MPGGDGLLVVLPGTRPDKLCDAHPGRSGAQADRQMYHGLERALAGEDPRQHGSPRRPRRDIRAHGDPRPWERSLRRGSANTIPQHNRNHRLQSKVFDLQLAVEALQSEADRVAGELKAEGSRIFSWSDRLAGNSRELTDKATAPNLDLRKIVAELTEQSENASQEISKTNK